MIIMAALLVEFGSTGLLDAAAELEIFPSAEGITLKVTIATPLAARPPRLHEIAPWPSLAQTPWLELAPANDTFAGRLSINTTLLASLGP